MAPMIQVPTLLPRIQKYKPRNKLKKLQWDKISNQNIKNTIWDKLIQPTHISKIEESLKQLGVFDDLDTHFSITQVLPKEIIKKTINTEETFLDTTKAQNISKKLDIQSDS